MVTFLLRAAIGFPDHPFTGQELTVTFICWIAHIQDLFDGRLLNPPDLTRDHLDNLWDNWQTYKARADEIQQKLAHPPV